MSGLPNSKPSLLLDFANSRSLDPRVTFTRASSATHFSAQGLLVTVGNNMPRFDHNPATGESLGLLIEEARTNLFLRSEEFNVSPWTLTNATVSANVTTTTAPDGTNTSDKLVESAANGFHSVDSPAFSFVNGTSYSMSVFAKPAGRSRFSFVRSGSGGASASFNTEALTAINEAGASSVSIIPVGNGWFRCTMSWVASASASRLHSIALLDSSGVLSYTGNGTSGIYLWGAQLEAGAFPTSYIPTTSAAVTRAADVASMTGANFTQWNNPTSGTILARYNAGGWKTNNTPPADPLNLRKDVSDYTTDVTDRINRLMFYPRQLTAAEITALTS
jgi:hypothetical protein